MLRAMPQGWEPENWAEAQASRVAREITRLRGSHSAQWLSDRTEELTGWRVSRSVITDLENGRRRHVGVHELVVLALALSVAPLQLLYGSDDGAQIEYRPGEVVPRLLAVQEFSGITDRAIDDYERRVEALRAAVEATNAAAQEIDNILKDRLKGERGGR